MSLFGDWVLQHKFTGKSVAHKDNPQEDESSHAQGGGVPTSWTDFHTAGEKSPHFRQLRLRHRFVPPVKQPPELEIHRFEFSPPLERELAERSAYLKEMHRLGANPSFIGTDRQVVANATHDLNRRTNSPTARPKPRPHGWDIWYS